MNLKKAVVGSGVLAGGMAAYAFQPSPVVPDGTCCVCQITITGKFASYSCPCDKEEGGASCLMEIGPKRITCEVTLGPCEPP